MAGGRHAIAPAAASAIPAPYTTGESASVPPSALCSTWRKCPTNQMKNTTANVPSICWVRIALRWSAKYSPIFFAEASTCGGAGAKNMLPTSSTTKTIPAVAPYRSHMLSSIRTPLLREDSSSCPLRGLNAFRTARATISLRVHIEELGQPGRTVRADDQLFEDADADGTVVAAHTAHRLDVLVERRRLVDLGHGERLAVAVGRAQPIAVTVGRVRVPDAVHVEVVQRLQRERPHAARKRQLQLEPEGVAG